MVRKYLHQSGHNREFISQMELLKRRHCQVNLRPSERKRKKKVRAVSEKEIFHEATSNPLKSQIMIQLFILKHI